MKIALLGNPNSGKSSLFNHLTGLRQKVGNFPGVTVDKKIGTAILAAGQKAQIIDFPGTYSLYPNSLDEQVVLDVMADPANPDYPDVAVVVADSTNLKRNMLLFEQVSDLGIPSVLALNMLDEASELGISVNSPKMSSILGVPVVEINAREGIGLEGLKRAILQQAEKPAFHENHQVLFEGLEEPLNQVKDRFHLNNTYLASQYLAQNDKLNFLQKNETEELRQLADKYGFDADTFQANETVWRYQDIAGTLDQSLITETKERLSLTDRLDKVLLHRFWGYVIFLAVLFIIFQSVFLLASYPQDLIDAGTADLVTWLHKVLPEGKLTDLLTEGVISGIGGIVIFVPQIALLFILISILEESGYMSRVVVLMDRFIRPFGMSGRSVVPLISGMACAVPAIMSARTIGNWKDRLITIMVTPLMSCAARLPIYTIIIALVVPQQSFFGPFGMQGIWLMLLYLLGFFMALIAGWVMKKVLKSNMRSFFAMELPTYKTPRWTQVFYTVLEKVKTFVFEAGKVILAISVILWVLSSYGPGEEFNNAEEIVQAENPTLSGVDLENKVASFQLSNSYAGHFGKFIEPVIRPLGYDWKIGIALLTSFAAREVFVGTVSTIYSIGSSADDENTIKARLRREVNPETGEPTFNMATSASLLVFYAFAMMCMSTLAVVYRETKGWKWPMIQLGYMTALAYISAFIVYQLLK
ncbi:ferrous iron transport protein B [Marinilongibacter aquaticus]|uniref:ferrous iron transport protein B n=1 Tax=Marinilongibacter aquaticus TaxID=2975157 RepID=UPI0021BDB947|nr:ferrous iron transport protein B [Marinilongibacter aquaticus]UBM60115.1 ferrous iron transport protein B [Marinilongibacter aquaticus]